MNNNLSKLSSKQESWIQTEIECSDDELVSQENLASLPMPVNIPIDIKRQSEMNLKGENK